jgi:heptosyltransferase II
MGHRLSRRHALPPVQARAEGAVTLARVSAAESPNLERLLVVLPNWIGDVVLATPVLAALRTHFPASRISYLLRPYVGEVIEGGGWHDATVHWPAVRGFRRELSMLRLAGRLREERFDAALLLTNSFRSAFVVWQAGIRRRVGYARDWRTWLLTDRPKPERANGVFVPRSVLPYYAALAAALGCTVTDWRLRLGVTPQQEHAGQELLRHYDLLGRRYAVVNPGAAFGAAKCWLPERFAECCDRLRTEHGLAPVLVGAKGELPLLRRIAELAHGPVVCREKPATTLGSLKVVIRDAALLLCNDTGPRHYGIAFDVPTVTIFGPTHQAWTAVQAPREIRLQAKVDCGPCQLRVCPLDHRCMTAVTVEMVIQAAAKVLAQAPQRRE